ncbi:hypothetical protein DFH29DRAFT_894006 [Suillus ampliporus]|nr:hypothetical protein DFH29DRAFT_894006 [Suillus ampliporus]
MSHPQASYPGWMPPHSVIHVGDVVMYIPRRPMFAQSSASNGGNPATYARPCIVIDINPVNTQLTVAPLCGARRLSDGTWALMVEDWWHPTEFANTGVQIPRDGLGRQPITLTYNPFVAKPNFMPLFKPCYMWVGDAGEFVPILQAPHLPWANNYLRIDAQQLGVVQQWWRYWAHHNPPTY